MRSRLALHQRRSSRWAALAIALSFTAAACASGGEDEGAVTTTAPEAPSQPASDDEAASNDAADDSTAAADDGDAVPETTEPGAGEPADGAEPTTTDIAVVVPTALQFTAPLLGGGEFDGAEVAGKPTVFWFWAPT